MKLRSFLAFDINEDMRNELGKLIEFLEPKAKGVKWIDPKLMHCTIKFFGDIEETLITEKLGDAIRTEVLKTPIFKLKGLGIGAFPNWRYPNVIWAGLTGETEPVIDLHKRLENLFEPLGISRDRRVLRLHLTLGRIKENIKDKKNLLTCVEKLSAKEFGELIVKTLVLYKSQLTPTGPVYTPLNEFPLKEV